MLHFVESSMCILMIKDKACCQQKINAATDSVISQCNKLATAVYEYSLSLCKVVKREAISASETGCFLATKLVSGFIMDKYFEALDVPKNNTNIGKF